MSHIVLNVQLLFPIIKGFYVAHFFFGHHHSRSFQSTFTEASVFVQSFTTFISSSNYLLKCTSHLHLLLRPSWPLPMAQLSAREPTLERLLSTVEILQAACVLSQLIQFLLAFTVRHCQIRTGTTRATAAVVWPSPVPTERRSQPWYAHGCRELQVC